MNKRINKLQIIANKYRVSVRTCINCKRAEKFDDKFIKCDYDDGLIHVSMAQKMADGCLQYLPKER